MDSKPTTCSVRLTGILLVLSMTLSTLSAHGLSSRSQIMKTIFGNLKEFDSRNKSEFFESVNVCADRLDKFGSCLGGDSTGEGNEQDFGLSGLQFLEKLRENPKIQALIRFEQYKDECLAEQGPKCMNLKELGVEKCLKAFLKDKILTPVKECSVSRFGFADGGDLPIPSPADMNEFKDKLSPLIALVMFKAWDVNEEKMTEVAVSKLSKVCFDDIEVAEDIFECALAKVSSDEDMPSEFDELLPVIKEAKDSLPIDMQLIVDSVLRSAQRFDDNPEETIAQAIERMITLHVGKCSTKLSGASKSELIASLLGRRESNPGDYLCMNVVWTVKQGACCCIKEALKTDVFREFDGFQLIRLKDRLKREMVKYFKSESPFPECPRLGFAIDKFSNSMKDQDMLKLKELAMLGNVCSYGNRPDCDNLKFTLT